MIEARPRIGGRVLDSEDLGLCVGKGAQMITGCTNNPMAVIGEEVSRQLTIKGCIFLCFITEQL